MSAVASARARDGLALARAGEVLAHRCRAPQHDDGLLELDDRAREREFRLGVPADDEIGLLGVEPGAGPIQVSRRGLAAPPAGPESVCRSSAASACAWSAARCLTVGLSARAAPAAEECQDRGRYDRFGRNHCSTCSTERPLSTRVILDLIGADPADGEVLRVRMGEVDAAHRRRGRHRVAPVSSMPTSPAPSRSNSFPFSLWSGHAG